MLVGSPLFMLTWVSLLKEVGKEMGETSELFIDVMTFTKVQLWRTTGLGLGDNPLPKQFPRKGWPGHWDHYGR
jgi:hypothetical protein